ncbi:hypothetical protein VNO77_20498 [Canavalia gladiata]|uniref:Uncharacterized protein n=1 Tax=Canavalia gladiata TaxID=3824 RepID=A0AAN9QQM1_CANGL
MASTAALSDKKVHKVSLKILVDKQKNKVLFAEAGKDGGYYGTLVTSAKYNRNQYEMNAWLNIIDPKSSARKS